jgi:hypothetical protein
LTASRPVHLGVRHPLTLIRRFSFSNLLNLFYFCVERPLCREGRSVIFSSATPWPETLRSHNHTLLRSLRLRTPCLYPLVLSSYPQALGSLFVAYYHSQGYAEGSLTHLNTNAQVQIILRQSVSRSVYPGIRPPSGTRDNFSFSSLEIIFRN